MRIINMAHGDMVMLGMFGAYWGTCAVEARPLRLACCSWVPLMFVFGACVHRLLLRRIIPGGELNTLLYTAGLSLLIANLALFFWTGDYRTINLAYALAPARPFGIAVPLPSAIAFAIAIVITTGAVSVPVAHRHGQGDPRYRAEPDSAALMGVDVGRIDMITFGLGTALAGAAGVRARAVALPLSDGRRDPGRQVLRHRRARRPGLGPGAIAGGILLGLVESLGAVYVSVALSDTIGFVLFLLVLLFRPSGLFGVGRIVIEPHTRRPRGRRAARRCRSLHAQSLLSAPAHHGAVLTRARRGLNLLGGFAGQVSFGHATFLGVGAYTTMLLYLKLGWSRGSA